MGELRAEVARDQGEKFLLLRQLPERQDVPEWSDAPTLRVAGHRRLWQARGALNVREERRVPLLERGRGPGVQAGRHARDEGADRADRPEKTGCQDQQKRQPEVFPTRRQYAPRRERQHDAAVDKHRLAGMPPPVHQRDEARELDRASADGRDREGRGHSRCAHDSTPASCRSAAAGAASPFSITWTMYEKRASGASDSRCETIRSATRWTWSPAMFGIRMQK